MTNFWSTNWADIVTIIGFFLTIALLLNAKTISKATLNAIEDTRKKLRKNLALVDLTNIINLLDEIRSLLRVRKWEIVLDRLSTLKKSIVSIRYEYHNITDEQQKFIQETLSQILIIEERIEKAFLNYSQIDILEVNKYLSKIAVEFSKLIETLKIK